MARKRSRQAPVADAPEESLAVFACPNPECSHFNRFGAGNLNVAERMGKHKHIRRLYCRMCGHRFSERQGSLLQYTKLSEDIVVRIIKCLGHGCSIEATADICEVDPRTVERMLEKAGRRADDFHRLQLQRLETPPAVVQMDELHARVSPPRAKKRGLPSASGGIGSLVARVAAWAGSGFTRHWPSSADS